MAYESTNRSKLKLIDLSDNTSVSASGGTNIQTLQPDAGMIYKIRYITYSAATPGGTASGTHELEIFLYSQTSGTTSRPARVVSNHNAVIQIGNGSAFVGDSSETPSTQPEQQALILNGILMASNTYTIKFIYTNDTDVAQTNTRTLKILVEEIPERI